MSEPFEAAVDRMLTYMALNSPRPRDPLDARLPMSVFDGAEAWDIHTPDQALIFTDVSPADVGRQWNQCVITPGDEPDGGRDFGLYQLTRVQRVPVSKARGLRICSPTVAMISKAWVDADGGFETFRCFMGLTGGEWVMMKPNSFVRSAEFSNAVRIGLGLQFTYDYRWHVRMRYDGFPGLSFVTDPVGAREVFRLRDIPEGKKRRAALRHWVLEHWRQSRPDPEEEIKIRDYLRGATEFVWNGLHCSITPSLHDANRATELKSMPRDTRAVLTPA